MTRSLCFIAVVFWTLLTPAAAQDAQGRRNPNAVTVFGTIHGTHEDSERYSLQVLERAIRAFGPDYIVTEIPPDRLAEAAAGFARHGVVSEPRVSVFPEYTEVVFPLTRELPFRIIPAAAWSQGMAAYRRQQLARIEADPTRAKDWKAYRKGLASLRAGVGNRGDDPAFIHSDAYDEITRKAFAPYEKRFADDLGRGDWAQINADHYALIEAALNQHTGEGARVLITFGSSHKYYILDQLRKRDDIKLIDAAEYFD